MPLAAKGDRSYDEEKRSHREDERKMRFSSKAAVLCPVIRLSHVLVSSNNRKGGIQSTDSRKDCF